MKITKSQLKQIVKEELRESTNYKENQMKITKPQLQKIIKEELENVLNEQRRPFERNKEIRPQDTGDKTTDDFSVQPLDLEEQADAGRRVQMSHIKFLHKEIIHLKERIAAMEALPAGPAPGDKTFGTF